MELQRENTLNDPQPFRRMGGGQCTGSGSLPLVSGEAERLLFVLLQKGAAVIEYCSARFPYTPGKLLGIPFGYRITLQSDDSVTFSYMSCMGAGLLSSITGPAIAVVESKWGEQFALCCTRAGEANLSALLSQGIPSLERLGDGEGKREGEKAVPPWLLRCKQVLDAFPQEPVSLERLEQELGVSRFRVIREFRLKWNTTPMEYLAQRRLCEAQKLLLESRATITVIAEEVGYGSPPYFIKCFKKHFGITPAAYRAASKGL